MTSQSHPATLPCLLKSLALALVLAVAPAAAYAQDSSTSSEQPSQEQPAPQPGPDTVVATVGGEPITEADLAFAAEDIGAALNQIPPDQLRAVLLAQMIDL